MVIDIHLIADPVVDLADATGKDRYGFEKYGLRGNLKLETSMQVTQIGECHTGKSVAATDLRVTAIAGMRNALF
jgi:hypothetical protein